MITRTVPRRPTGALSAWEAIAQIQGEEGMKGGGGRVEGAWERAGNETLSEENRGRRQGYRRVGKSHPLESRFVSRIPLSFQAAERAGNGHTRSMRARGGGFQGGLGWVRVQPPAPCAHGGRVGGGGGRGQFASAEPQLPSTLSISCVVHAPPRRGSGQKEMVQRTPPSHSLGYPWMHDGALHSLVTELTGVPGCARQRIMCHYGRGP